jgi:hypothetical protein
MTKPDDTHGAHPRTLPDFLVIGAARSGTTWIAKNLDSHPDIFIPREKELHFFDYQYSKGLDFYASFYRNMGSATAIGEATPAYLHFEPAAARIRKHLPDANMIASLRNPVDRLYSRYWNARGRFLDNKHLSFEEKLTQKPELIEEGFYVDHLQRFLKLFPREQFLILLFDELVADPATFMAEIYRFIGVSDNHSATLLEHKINAAADQKLLVKSRPIYWAERALRRVGLHYIAQRLEPRNSADLPPMSPDTRRWLIDVYREKNNQLEDLIGKDLSHWNAM